MGDSIYVKLQPYVLASVARHSNQNLPLKFFSPFKIIALVGSVAYKLDLPPPSALVHLVFHVSQLKLSQVLN
jgi:hypothetical protein